ncbi:MAG TPA: DUF4340 domain-containing protein [Mobilitalea sp.]|nr:DUF4340 domain-containing protein [Mobilitalea sp.]
MSKRKKKNAITLIFLLLALVLLIVFYIWYSGRDKAVEENDSTANRQEEGAAKEDASLNLATMDPTLIDTLHFSNPEVDLTLVCKEEVWKSEANPERPINQENVSKMLNILVNVKAQRLISEKPEDLGEYGLSEPRISVEAFQSDGKTLTLKVGDKAVGVEGYYARVNEEDAVYLLAVGYGTEFSYTDTDMTAVAEDPVITSDNIFHIEVMKKDGDNFELLYDTENTLDGTGSGLFPWVILKPYEEGYAADSSKVSEVLPSFSTFDFIACVDYSGVNLDKYGLEDPTASILVEYYEYYTMTLETPETDPNTGEEITEKTYYEAKNIKIHVGSADNTGNYYVRLDGDNLVYTMPAEDIEGMLTVDPFKVISSFISLQNIESIDRIDVEIEGQPYTMEIKRETITNDAGEADTKATYYYNGKTVQEDVFKGVYQVMIAAGYDAKIMEAVDTEGVTPFMTISYQAKGKILNKTSYLPYNESFYIIDNGGQIRFFADKRKIDNIADRIVKFNKLEE